MIDAKNISEFMIMLARAKTEVLMMQATLIEKYQIKNTLGKDKFEAANKSLETIHMALDEAARFRVCIEVKDMHIRKLFEENQELIKHINFIENDNQTTNN